MPLKDYYSILEIKSSATQAEIKKAFRKLAHQFHPDKNKHDPYYTAQFAEVKEAYEVLTNPAKKEYYLQQRWYDQSTGKRKTQDIITPVALLKQVLELERYVSKLDVFRMDKEGLHDYLSILLTDTTIEKLNSFNDEATNEEIIKILLACFRPLPFDLVLSLQKQLIKIRVNPGCSKKISDWMAGREKIHTREKYKVWIILLVVAVLCLLIFFLRGNK
ncbi:MAG TPA: DnaJ domain-containing protein [Chitinophagaceae bacterium]|nr:DnaJ domain-containing protein [Chitinophagaceae bacterium]